jgi:hypothetical protein
LCIGQLYSDWRRDHPNTTSSLQDFAQEHFAMEATVPKKLRQFVLRCEQLYQKSPEIIIKPGRNYKRKAHTMKTSFAKRRRLHGLQGRPTMCPELRDALFQWFVDARSSVKGRLWTRTEKAVAAKLRGVIERHCRAVHKAPPKFPVIDGHWLRGWPDEYGVSFKKPTKKFKVSRTKILARTRVTTLDAYIARYVFQQLYGAERAAMGLRPEPIMISCDQKGVHYNESECKLCGTLDFIGDEAVELKTNHGQSRSRLSWVERHRPTSPDRQRYFGSGN